MKNYNEFNSILFVCRLNAIRSPIAEYFFKSHLKNSRIQVESCGFEILSKDFMTIEVMSEINIDLSNHLPKTLTKKRICEFNLIIAFSKSAFENINKITKNSPSIVEFIDVPVSNITRGNREQKLFYYREIRDRIIKEIKLRF